MSIPSSGRTRSSSAAARTGESDAGLKSSKFSGDAALEAVARGEKTLGQGARGAAVKKVQEALVIVGRGISADGAFGPKTRDGLKGFQKDAGLPQTGKLDAATLQALDTRIRATDVEEISAPGSIADVLAQPETTVAASERGRPASDESVLNDAVARREARRRRLPPLDANAPLGLSTGPLGMNRLMVETEDGRRINLLPSFADLQSVVGGPGGRPAAPVPGPRKRDPEADMKTLLHGVPQPVIDQPWQASFDDYFQARAAVSDVPTALAGMALKPLADGSYKVVDKIPAPIRRPFDRAVGILLDNAVSAPANLLTSHNIMNTGALPHSANLNLPAYPQIRNSCGETMVATWLKGQGVPIALGEVDTQFPFFDGSNALEDAELRNRGFSVVSGPGSFDDLKTYVAHGYPVMVSVGWEGGGGHYAVVTGYDEATKSLTIDSYDADGKVAKVPYETFKKDWERHKNLMMVAHPQKDARLKKLRDAGRLSRKAEVQEGVSVSDIWVNQRLEFFVEAAYRYKGTKDDLTVRLNVNSAEQQHGAANMIGGSVRYTHNFDQDTSVTVYGEKLTVKGPQDAENVDAILKNVALYVGARHKGVSARAGYERGAFQAALQAELNTRLATMGAEARVSVLPDGNYSVFLGAQGHF